MQLSTDVRNARLNAIETLIGASPILKVYDLTGGAPANCAAAIVGTVLATLTLPADWLAAAAGGAASKSGAWQDLSADADGNADFFRIYDSTDTTCHIQGTVTITGGGGDMTIDVVAVVSGKIITVTSFTLTDGNA